MGRKRKYFTNEDKRDAKRRDNELYYQRHKKSILKKRMRKYWKSVDEDVP